MREATTSYVALLRGINVGGKHIVPMKQLAELFAECNCSKVCTYIQSGNVIFRASPATVKQLAKAVTKRMEDRFGFSAPVIIRSSEQLAQAIRANPFLKAGRLERELHMYFLAGEPRTEDVRSLDPGRSAPDEFYVSGQEIYLYLPKGMARTKLTNAYFDSRLSTVATARNWATVLKLHEMMQSKGVQGAGLSTPDV